MPFTVEHPEPNKNLAEQLVKALLTYICQIQEVVEEEKGHIF